MKVTGTLVSAILVLSSAVVEAASLRHSHHQRRHDFKIARREPEPQRGRGRGRHTSTVTKYVTSTKTKWVDAPTPTPEQKAEDIESDSESEDESGAAPNEYGFSDVGVGLDREFPDGEIGCDTFPIKYGAIAVPWVYPGENPWTSIQYQGGNPNRCEGDGALCSYACPPGWAMAQWPPEQPESGESHGGLRCKGGKLYKTHPTYKTLCIPGHGHVYVKNTLSKPVAICQTAYPGTENMVIPTWVRPGETKPLTVIESERYFKWRNMKTSAQFYVQPAGQPLDKGCIWGKPGGGVGNWTPMIWGASYDAGQTWISIAQNQLNSSPHNFNVRIVGDKVSGGCKYENKRFQGPAATHEGCTAAFPSGNAYYEIY